MILAGGSPARRRLPVVACAAVAAVLLAGCTGSKDADDEGDAPAATTTSTSTPLVGTLTPTEAVIAGQCLDDVPDPAQQTYAVMVIPCEDPHTYEVYAQAKLDLGATPTQNGAPYPGALAVANGAESQCVGAFPQFMGVKWEESEYDIQSWWPSEQSWATKKDRTILCAVYRVTGGKTKGTVRGSGQ